MLIEIEIKSLKKIVTNIVPQFNSIINKHSLPIVGTWNRKPILRQLSSCIMNCGTQR